MARKIKAIGIRINARMKAAMPTAKRRQKISGFGADTEAVLSEPHAENNPAKIATRPPTTRPTTIARKIQPPGWVRAAFRVKSMDARAVNKKAARPALRATPKLGLAASVGVEGGVAIAAGVALIESTAVLTSLACW